MNAHITNHHLVSLAHVHIREIDGKLEPERNE